MRQAKAQPYNERFPAFIKLFALIGKDSRVFPKKCRTCGKEFESFPEYIHATSPLQHCLEDYREASDAFGTMQYRNCACGGTLLINFTRDVYPSNRRLLGDDRKRSQGKGHACTGSSLGVQRAVQQVHHGAKGPLN